MAERESQKRDGVILQPASRLSLGLGLDMAPQQLTNENLAAMVSSSLRTYSKSVCPTTPPPSPKAEVSRFSLDSAVLKLPLQSNFSV
ncbi:hypothetical protein AOLI_G00261870 [Acnodon oligacanthus]